MIPGKKQDRNTNSKTQQSCTKAGLDTTGYEGKQSQRKKKTEKPKIIKFVPYPFTNFIILFHSTLIQ